MDLNVAVCATGAGDETLFVGFVRSRQTEQAQGCLLTDTFPSEIVKQLLANPHAPIAERFEVAHGPYTPALHAGPCARPSLPLHSPPKAPLDTPSSTSRPPHPNPTPPLQPHFTTPSTPHPSHYITPSIRRPGCGLP